MSNGSDLAIVRVVYCLPGTTSLDGGVFGDFLCNLRTNEMPIFLVEYCIQTVMAYDFEM